MMSSCVIDALWRHPVKGFTPEAVHEAVLTEGDFFPFDRMFALEVGPSGFDKNDPQFISKMKFAVLARFAAIAQFNSRYNEFDDQFEITGTDGRAWTFDLAHIAGQNALARHVENILIKSEDYDVVLHPLKLLTAPGFDNVQRHYRFTDSAKGFVSFLNLNSLRDLGQRLNLDLDPRRLRANIWLEGLSAFEDHDWVGRHIRVGEDGPQFEVLKPIVRCVATHVNPDTTVRDIDICTGLWQHYGHRDCGIYARITRGGAIKPGDQIHAF